jgi:lysozyme
VVTADDPVLIAQLMRHEGVALLPYVDTTGNLTIGVGRNLTSRGITADEAAVLLHNDLELARGDLVRFPWFAFLSPSRQRALIDMRFNLGPSRFRGFAALLAALERQDYQAASVAMLDSKWARQVGARADRLATMLRDDTRAI